MTNYESLQNIMPKSPDELIQEGKDIKSISEIEETGDHFKVTVTTGTKILTNSFTIGQETELSRRPGESQWTGRTVASQNQLTHLMHTSVVMREGNKLTAILNGIEYVTELTDSNTLVNTMTLSVMSYKRTSKRM
ncbi:fatty acid binding protein 1-B.1-like [Oncorhynchus nerka]|uniref:fatty acid binding protein 1-B.1-like n=1 Tax=Oncorhynchus nerka TaxID=8023 RepID=UPI0031B7FF35